MECWSVGVMGAAGHQARGVRLRLANGLCCDQGGDGFQSSHMKSQTQVVGFSHPRRGRWRETTLLPYTTLFRSKTRMERRASRVQVALSEDDPTLQTRRNPTGNDGCRRITTHNIFLDG